MFLGSIIYMGIHEEPDLALYWNIDLNSGTLYTNPSYISLKRFQQIKRYYYILGSEGNKCDSNDLP